MKFVAAQAVGSCCLDEWINFSQESSSGWGMVIQKRDTRAMSKWMNEWMTKSVSEWDEVKVKIITINQPTNQPTPRRKKVLLSFIFKSINLFAWMKFQSRWLPIKREWRSGSKNIQMEITRNWMEKKKRERGQPIEYEKKATNMRKLTEWWNGII